MSHDPGPIEWFDSPWPEPEPITIRSDGSFPDAFWGTSGPPPLREMLCEGEEES